MEIGDKLAKKQHGFRPGKSTSTAIRSVMEWTGNRFEKHVLEIFLDISGAFDNVCWQQLSQDMINMGCSNGIRKIVTDYLTNRKAEMEIGSIKCKIKLTRGVPQGSKLGPRLWNITMDALLKMTLSNNIEMIAYADDLVILVAGDTRLKIVKEAEEMLGKAVEWAETRGLNFSKEKSVMVPMKGGLVPGFTAGFGSGRIRSVSKVKYLGLTMGCGMDFKEHVDSVTISSQDMFLRLRSTRRSKWGMSSDHALLVYRAVYIHRVSYGAEIWYDFNKNSKAMIEKLEKCQRIFIVKTHTTKLKNQAN